MTAPTHFREHVAAERRLAVLQTLAESVQYESNEYTLQALLDDMGLGVSTVALRADLARLAEQGLLDTRSVGGVTIAGLKQTGLDVARGKSRAEGVARPRPE